MLDGISRVKQHLSRKHAPEFYCEYCMAVLPNKQAHQAHVEARACSYRACRFPGITHQQQRELSRRSKPNLSEPERWFAIWDIVFPGRPRPASPYIDTDLSEDLCQFKEFAEAFGPAIVATQMQVRLADAEPGEAAEEENVAGWAWRRTSSAAESEFESGPRDRSTERSFVIGGSAKLA
ncbi:67585750-113b-4780-a839-bc8f1f764144 [Thermothielavioides terrestris]|uniref:67585750-113b-4780-a839-bc8f1f764144 n=1 Tax=Thermothielavioides terrestris TaxID=2587410 RepID=A0A446BQ28_9PEZI|nr:67585750-113b-4780-a839-bc8f1f764144 [Thermothielavioides terrestris]